MPSSVVRGEEAGDFLGSGAGVWGGAEVAEGEDEEAGDRHGVPDGVWRPLRRSVVGALRAMNPKLEEARALIYAEVIVQLIKGMLMVYREAMVRDG